MTAAYDAIVVGGGIVGASTAYHLAKAGTKTLLLDREDEGRATDAGAGILSPATSARSEDDDWYALGRAALAYYPELVAQLERAGVETTSYAQPGYLCVAPSAERVEALERKLERLERLRDRFGTPAPGSVERMDGETATERFPPLAAPEDAFLYADAGRVDGRVFTAALLDAGRTHGLTVENGDVSSIAVDDGAATGVVTASGDRVSADDVVIAGGAWSGAFGSQLGVRIPVEPQRGQIVHLDVPDADTEGWPILAGWGHYAVPWDDGRVAVGATNEDAGFDPRATVAGVREILDAAVGIAPALGDAALAEVRVGLRPVVTDGKPVLGPVPSVDGVVLATGHGPTGLLLGPYSGCVAASLVRGEGVDVPLDPFSVARFDRSPNGSTA